MTISLIVILVLVCLSAFFSGSETALTAVSKPLLHQLEQNGHARAGVVNRLLARKERLIGALLLGNTAVNILAGSILTSALITDYGEVGVAYATVALTVVILMFSEILPKTYALHNANSMAQAVARPVAVVVALFSPIVQVIQLALNGILWLFGAKFISRTDVDAALAELRGAIEMHTSDEDVKRERAMLRSILDLDDVTVDEVMTHRKSVAMIDASLPAAEIVDAVLESPHTRIPLWRDNHDNVIGVINAKVLLRAVRAHPGDIDSLDVAALASAPWFIPDTSSLLDQLQAFRERREHFALVVDEYGTLMGVVTLEDILEEIVGDISDEHDVAVIGVRAEPDGSYIVNGHVTLRDLNRELDWRLPDEEASTIAGLVLHESRQIPEVGQTFLFHGFRFEVLRRQRNQLTAIKVTPPTEKKEE